jgi:hypothetical protein
MKRSTLLVRGLTLVAAFAALPFTFAQSAKPATLEEALAQIEELKKQTAELETFVRSQMAPAAKATNVAVVASAASKAPDAPADFVKWNELTVGKSKFKLYGFLRADAVYDDSRTGGNGANSAYIPAMVLSENGLGGAANQAVSPNHDNLIIHPRLTRFGIDFTGLQIASLWDAKVGGKLEIDFYNFLPGGSESREFLRMRHAYATMKWDEFQLLAGQTSDLVSQYFPVVNPDFIMWGAGNLGDRRPQFRLDYTPKIGAGTGFIQGMVGMTGADDNRDLDNNGVRDGEASGRPTLQTRMGYRQPIGEKKQLLEFAVWGHNARETVDLGLPPGGRQNFNSYAAGFDVMAPIYSDIVAFKGEIWTGRNMDDLRGGILQGINTATARTIRADGGWAELSVKPIKWYSIHGGYTIDNPQDDDLPGQAPGQNNVWYVANRFYFDPMEFGLDYLNWTTHYKDPAGRGKGQDNRFQASLSYKF